jgi:very-short-patch-repair endonuclease
MDIKKEDWHVCRFCNKKIIDLAKIYGGSGIYYTKVFRTHLKEDHNIECEEYFNNRPLCGCGICKREVDINLKGSSFRWKEYKCGRNEGVIKWSKEAKISRLGENNPMFHKIPWNKGLTKETSESMKRTSDKMKGKKSTEEQKQKMSESAKKRTVHGHTGKKHSEYSKELMRQETLRNIKKGTFKQTKTKPHIEFGKILDKNKIKYEEEKIVDCWSFDYYIIDFDIYVEVDGDYFHSNPKIFPNGPKTSTQKKNYYRDVKKNEFCKINSLKLIRFWECDILNDEEKIICDLQKSLILKK